MATVIERVFRPQAANPQEKERVMKAMRMAIGLAISAFLVMGIGVASAATVNFDWPPTGVGGGGAGGYYESNRVSGTGSGFGRQYTDYAHSSYGSSSVFSVVGAGLGGSVRITTDASGDATLTANPDGVGIRQNSVNNFELLAQTVNVVHNGYALWTEVRSVSSGRKTTDHSQALIYGPGHVLDLQGGSVTFSVNAAGTVTLGGSHPGIVAHDSTIELLTEGFIFDPRGFTGQWEIVGWNFGRVNGRREGVGLIPGSYSVNLFSSPTTSFSFTVGSDYQPSQNYFPFTDNGQSYTFKVALPEPSGLLLLSLGSLGLARRTRQRQA